MVWITALLEAAGNWWWYVTGHGPHTGEGKPPQHIGGLNLGRDLGGNMAPWVSRWRDCTVPLPEAG